MQQQLDISEILKRVPHRYPFLLVDRILELVPGESITALKNVSVNEPHFCGHFPEIPVMPGVLIIEAMAQAAGVYAFATTDTTHDDGLYYLAGIYKARFKKIVRPGDQLIMQVKLLKQKREIWKFLGEARVDGELACTAEMICAKKD